MAQKQGLMVFGSDGYPILEITDRLTKYSGEADIYPTADSGTIQCPDLTRGMGLWYFITNVYLSASEPILGDVETPYISATDAVGYFNWRYYSRSGTRVGVHIIYGVY